MNSKKLAILGIVAMVFAFVGGYGFHTALAQQKSSAGQSTEKLPADLHPETLSRMPLPTREELSTPEDLQVFDKAVIAAPHLVKPGFTDPGNRMRLHIPVVHQAYRDTIQNLNQKNGLDPRYHQLSTLVACREMNEEYDWLSHEKQSRGKVLPPEIIEIVRDKKDTKGLEEKDAVLIQFGRELFRQPKVSSKTFADMERLFGRRSTLALTLIMAHYTDNALMYRAYDQRVDPAEKRPFPDVLAMEAKQR